jgi:hypothetical protein
MTAFPVFTGQFKFVRPGVWTLENLTEGMFLPATNAFPFDEVDFHPSILSQILSLDRQHFWMLLGKTPNAAASRNGAGTIDGR